MNRYALTLATRIVSRDVQTRTKVSAVMSSARYYTYRQATTEGGYPASRTVQEILAAVHRSPILRDGAAVFSTRGQDFVITVGGDLAAGYRWHDRESIHLFCAETLAAQTMTPEAVCVLA